MAIQLDMIGIYRGGTVGTPSLSYYKKDTFLNILENDLSTTFLGSGGRDFTEDDSTVNYYHSSLNKVVNYPAIFDNPHVSQKVNIGADFNGIRPQIQVQETKLKAIIRKEDTVTVRGVNYAVEDYAGDGVGVVTMYLRRA